MALGDRAAEVDGAEHGEDEGLQRRHEAQLEEVEEHAGRQGEDAQHLEAEALAEARRKREEMMAQTRRDIEQETRRAIQEIRNEVADLTVLATEKVTRKSLDSADQKRLVEEALAELDFSTLASEERN